MLSGRSKKEYAKEVQSAADDPDGAPAVGVLTSCSAMFEPAPRIYGEPPSECRSFPRDAQVQWVGNGRLGDFGLGGGDIDLTGDIYVQVYVEVTRAPDARPLERQFCVITDDGGVGGGPVPEGWLP